MRPTERFGSVQTGPPISQAPTRGSASGPLSRFVERHPSVTILALAFLLLIGGNLLIDGFGYHVPKGYTYTAMGFAVAVEMLQLRYRKKTRSPGARPSS